MPNDLKYSDWVKSISTTKEYLLDEVEADDTDLLMKSYHPYLVSKSLLQNPQTIYAVNTVNMLPGISKKMHYDYLFHYLPKSKPKTKTPKKGSASKKSKVNATQLNAIKEYYGYSNEKAKSAIEVLSPMQIHQITYWVQNNKGGKG